MGRSEAGACCRTSVARTDEKGQVVFFVRIGWMLLEFDKGKTGIVAGSMERLPAVIDTLIEAVRAGELDLALETARSARGGDAKTARKSARVAA